ncbi:Thioredoxin-like protein 1 [Fukomys damarensis]|uniref:Thioredoxin-like protein 1 n=2 Tax=Euarchontoglires TaxID=314146 RepID=A0A091CR86_FUKDA|nr:Thioredoxin-like protein 1 [Fukomys damarensis]
MVGVKPVGSDPDFQPELSGAGSRLAVVKFTMRGCGPCLRIAPAFSSMSNKYPQAVFLEVDVHQCQGTAATNNISATPTFLFFRNKVRIDQYQGADAVGLEEKIKQHLENDPGSNEDTDIPKGYMDLMPFINKAGCECLNESDEHGFDNCLRKDTTFLESDCDEQLLITVAFNQPVKLYSMKFQGPDNGQGPKYVKIFINLPRSMDFEEAETSEPTQALELTEDDIKEDGIVPLRYVKFQNVNSVTIFVQSNQGEEETTRISYFTFIGTPVQATNMNDFKRAIQNLRELEEDSLVLPILRGGGSQQTIVWGIGAVEHLGNTHLGPGCEHIPLESCHYYASEGVSPSYSSTVCREPRRWDGLWLASKLQSANVSVLASSSYMPGKLMLSRD